MSDAAAAGPRERDVPAAGALPDADRGREGRSALELAAGREGLPRLWRRRSAAWQIRLRWAVAPLMIGGAIYGRFLGLEFLLRPIVVIALATLAYNTLFALMQRRSRGRHTDEYSQDRMLAIAGVVLDYAAMFLLIHYTGGVASPVSVFLIFHVIIAAIQFTAVGAYLLAGVAAAAMWFFLHGQTAGWLHCPPLGFRGSTFDLASQPALARTSLAFLSATLFITAGMVSRIVRRLRLRVGDLAEATSRLARANDRLNGLYRMLSAIGAEKRLEPVVSAVTEELGKVVQASVAVKLLGDDSQTLRYVALDGLPDEFVDEIKIRLDESVASGRAIEGQKLVEIGGGAAIPLASHSEALGIGWTALAPLEVDGRVIGTLGFFYREPRRLDDDDRSFAQRTAELVAIAIDHAQAHEKVQALMRERAEFMLEVAHNLRAPLAASLGLLSLLLDDMLGELGAEQRQHLERVQGRLRSLNETIGELLAIARTRDRSREIEDVVVDVGKLARRTRELFERQAKAKGLELTVELTRDLPAVESGVGILEAVMENLVSNSIKYTPAGGRVEVRFEGAGEETVRITVADTGIGIPAADRGRIFEQFFRASNARATTVNGTGLGLVFVQQAVQRQGGRLELESEEGAGTTITLTLPTRPTAAGA